jgi:hypothetical protein
MLRCLFAERDGPTRACVKDAGDKSLITSKPESRDRIASVPPPLATPLLFIHSPW